MKRFSGALVTGAVLLAASGATAQSVIRPGDTVRGTLSGSDRVLADGSFYDCFTLDARPGERLTVTLRSGDFDAYLAVVEGRNCPTDADGESDDDGAGGTDSLVRITLGGGPYSIRANSLSQGRTGAYTLAVETLEPPPAPQSAYLGVGQAQRFGELGAGDLLADDGSWFDCYTFDVPSGQARRIRLMSPEFDAYLSLHEGGACDAQIDSDDDGLGEGTDAMIQRTFTRGGRFSIRANSLGAGETGRYRLVLEVP